MQAEQNVTCVVTLIVFEQYRTCSEATMQIITIGLYDNSVINATISMLILVGYITYQ